MPPTRRVKGNIEGASAPQEKEAGLKSKQLEVCLAYGIILTQIVGRDGWEYAPAVPDLKPGEYIFHRPQRITVCFERKN